MEITIDISGFENRINKLKAALLNGEYGDSLIFGINAGMGLMQQRIFTNGKAADGTALGDYKSKSYKAKRVKAGRQTGYKDLEMTGSLRRGFVIAKSGNNASCIIANDTLIKIAEGQENQTGKKIWRFSDTEKIITVKNCQKALMQKIMNDVR